LDIWHGCLSSSRWYLKGWHANKESASKKVKKEALDRLEQLDKIVDHQVVREEHWRERYQLEAKLEYIYLKEELFWQQRSSE
jgi:hypothetical protein